MDGVKNKRNQSRSGMIQSGKFSNVQVDQYKNSDDGKRNKRQR